MWIVKKRKYQMNVYSDAFQDKSNIEIYRKNNRKFHLWVILTPYPQKLGTKKNSTKSDPFTF